MSLADEKKLIHDITSIKQQVRCRRHPFPRADAPTRTHTETATTAAVVTRRRDGQPMPPHVFIRPSPIPPPVPQKQAVVESAAAQAELDALKVARSEASERLRALVTTIRELREGVRKLDVLERVCAANPGVSLSALDIRVGEVPVPQEHLPALIGKKGQGLRDIEVAAGVVLDVTGTERDRERAAERAATGAAAAAARGQAPKAAASGEEAVDPDAPAVVKISGTPAGIAKATEMIAAITSQVRHLEGWWWGARCGAAAAGLRRRLNSPPPHQLAPLSPPAG